MGGTWAVGICSRWLSPPEGLGLRMGNQSQWRAGENKTGLLYCYCDQHVMIHVMCRSSSCERKAGGGENSADKPECTSYFLSVACLGLAQQLLQLILRQQTVVLHKGRDLRRSLGLVINCAMDLHVPVQNLQETFLTLLGEERKTIGWWDQGQSVRRGVCTGQRVCQDRPEDESTACVCVCFCVSDLCDG